jgi:hypothetical protein
LGLILLISIGMLIFSPSQYENFLWSFQFVILVPGLCLLLNLFVLRGNAGLGTKTSICIIVNCFATFVFANGMICWFLCVPALPVLLSQLGQKRHTSKKQLWIWTIVYFLACGLCFIIYFSDYQSVRGHPSTSYALSHTSIAANYFLVWIGSPHASFLQWTDTHILTARTVGALLMFFCLAVFGIHTILVVRGKLVSWTNQAYPWLCIIGYGLASGVMATVGRAGFGIEQALSPRYISFSSFVSIGLAAWVYVSLKHYTNAKHLQKGIAVLCLLLGAYNALGAIGWYVGAKTMSQIHQIRQQDLLTLRLSSVTVGNPLWKRLYFHAESAAKRAVTLQQAGLLPTTAIGNWLPARLSHPVGQALGGYVLRNVGDTATLVTGWAALPDSSRAADFVGVCRFDNFGHASMVSGLLVSGDNTEVARQYGLKSLGRSKFEVLFQTNTNFFHANKLKFVAIDTLRHKVYTLSQSQIKK